MTSTSAPAWRNKGETDCHGVRTITTSHFQPRRGRKSAVDIVLPFPIEGQAFNGDPRPPRNDRFATAFFYCHSEEERSDDVGIRFPPHQSASPKGEAFCGVRIATASVRTGFAMTGLRLHCKYCHCEEALWADAAIRLPLISRLRRQLPPEGEGFKDYNKKPEDFPQAFHYTLS